MKYAYLLTLLWTAALWASPSFESSRTHLNSLESRGRLDWADYRDDFLISQSAEITDVSSDELIRRLSAQRHKSKLELKTPLEKIEIPSQVITGSQLDGLQSCSLEKCAFKLHSETETKPLTQSKHRVKLFEQFVNERLKAFSENRKLKGYENRLDNVPAVKKAFQLSRFLKQRYPKSFEFLLNDFWNNTKGFSRPKNTYFRSEVIHITGENSQPIYRLSQNLEFEEKGYLNVEIHIYTNHFFDSSIRIYEIFPWPPDPAKAVYIVTDLMEVDELKKSDLIRTLFKSRMEEKIADFRKTEMKELR